MSDMKCPFCNKKLEPIGTSGQFQCGTWGCDASFNFIATRDVWEYIDRTRKALEVAKGALKELRPAEKKSCYLVPTVSTTQRIIDEALEQITALEQKDVK